MVARKARFIQQDTFSHYMPAFLRSSIFSLRLSVSAVKKSIDISKLFSELGPKRIGQRGFLSQ
jgi:hypothetical protein